MNINQEFSIRDRLIGSTHMPYVIAEMSANHNGSIENAFRIIEEAKEAGADAVKMQTYTPETITLNCNSEEFTVRGGLWDGRILYDLYQEAHTPWDWHRPLFEYAQKLEITIFSSPFDKTAIDLLEDLNAPAYKIASFEAIDLPLIKYAASTGKPLIISTGMANLEEIQEAIQAARDGGCKQLAILHCVSGYPAVADEYNLQTMTDMIRRFDVVVGLSDHTLDNTTAIASVALGGAIIEKHFTLNRQGGGPDDSFSLEPKDLLHLCSSAKTAWLSMGKVNYSRTSSELGNVKFRRSLYFVKALKAGQLITEDSLRSVRPGFGLAPKYYEQILGKIIIKDVKFGTPVSWDLVS
jgi:pseudaminic acid synthase